jgi:hypothetical protein
MPRSAAPLFHRISEALKLEGGYPGKVSGPVVQQHGRLAVVGTFMRRSKDVLLADDGEVFGRRSTSG